MIRAAHAAYFAALGLWAGGMAVLAFIVAPAVFRLSPSREAAGTLFGSILVTFGHVEAGLAVLLALSTWTLHRVPGGSRGFRRARALLVGLLLTLALACTFGVNPAAAQARQKIGSVSRLPEDDPGRRHFEALHRWSVRLSGAKLVAALGLLLLSGSRLRSSDGP